MNFKKKNKTRGSRKKNRKKKMFLKTCITFLRAEKKSLMLLIIFPIKTKGSGYLESKLSNFKILTTKEILQRLPIALAQIKAGNNSESLLNENRQIVYSLYQAKEITKKVYNNIIKSIKI